MRCLAVVALLVACQPDHQLVPSPLFEESASGKATGSATADLAPTPDLAEASDLTRCGIRGAPCCPESPCETGTFCMHEACGDVGVCIGTTLGVCGEETQACCNAAGEARLTPSAVPLYCLPGLRCASGGCVPC